MNSLSPFSNLASVIDQVPRVRSALQLFAFGVLAATASLSALAQTPLADQPVFAATNVPGNLVLALSVEFPTAVTAADRSSYSTIKKYVGYFDPLKCYDYVFNETINGSYFSPSGATDSSYGCVGKWSGNFLNWATMQAIDPFRWALTGGYRSIDTDTTTILEKAFAGSVQGGPRGNFPHKVITSGASSATPFSGSSFYMQALRCGTRMLFRQSSTAFTNDASCPTSTAWDGVVATASASTVYSVEVRVKVCDSGRLESNCVTYGSNSKPEGLIQKYASKIRYSAFGYLNDPLPDSGSTLRDGGVLRAGMKFVGPTQPVPGSAPITNPRLEWSAATGIFATNPDPSDATASSEAGSVITKSGVINYLNQFGLSAQGYKRFDPVSELYYASTRYLRNLSNVPEYSDLSRFNNSVSTLANRTAMKDGFPVISTWTDPILYSCQKNFVLGIGDTNTNQDKNLPGNTIYNTNEPGKPASVSADTINVVEATNKVGVIEGIGSSIGATDSYNGGNNSAYIAGMAYLFNTTDIRNDLAGTQTISTYWLDVLEGGGYKGGPTGRNQFYLAAKYGGFTVPDLYSYDTNTAALSQSLWSTSGETLPGLGARPDNFFTADQPVKMVRGLENAFDRISKSIDAAFTTSFSTSLPQVALAGNSSFSSKYDPKTWTGEVTASSLAFDALTGVPLPLVEKWKFTDKLAVQLSGAGWDTGRRVVTWNGSAGVAFRPSGGSMLNAADLLTLDTSYVAGNDSVNYLNYLRGERANEGTAYRTRVKLLGDIVGSKARPVGPPSFPMTDTTNAGYAAFKTSNASRVTVVYVASNDGMLHAINGKLDGDAAAGTEMFAYVPKALYQGPNNTPNTDGLASLGKPAFAHHYLVNATPNVYDIDLAKTAGSTGGTDWRSVLIGGLGKGGRSYYAVDVTNPESMATGTEVGVAGKVLWEFSDSDMGYTFGEPVVAKTAKYGWVVILTSGYNNADGKGYFLLVNPKTGALLEKVSTGVGSTTSSAGLAHANAFIVDASDGTADSVYAGDLLGNVWRLDLTGTGAYPAPIQLAALTDASANPQPVTTRPAIEVHPDTKKRFVMIGTGRLLDETDIASTKPQSFYAISDGTNAQFNSTLPPRLAFPIARSALANNSNALAGALFDPTTQMGWYEELGTDSGTGIAWRIVSDSTTLSGSVAFAAVLPSGEVCSPSGRSRVYGRNYATAKTTVNAVDVSGKITPTLFADLAGNVTDLRYLSVAGTGRLIYGTDKGVVGLININPLAGLALRRLNWRELQVVD